jgi:hypothetical protein
VSPSHSTNPWFPQGSCRQLNRRSHAVRPVTIRQLSQTVIKDELVRNGTQPRYTLNGHDFHIVNPILPPVSSVSDGIDLALTGHIRREHHRRFGRNHSDYPHRRRNRKDNIDAYDWEWRRGGGPTRVGVAAPRSPRVYRVRC